MKMIGPLLIGRMKRYKGIDGRKVAIMKKSVLLIVLIIVVLNGFIKARGTVNQSKSDTLVVLWTSGDIEVAEKVCFMYTQNAKKNQWFNEVILIVWGPSSRLLTENESLQKRIKAMKNDGVILQACIACADMYGVTEKLKSLGIEVKGMGKPLTNYLKSNYKVLCF
jgi:hypothetical protein